MVIWLVAWSWHWCIEIAWTIRCPGARSNPYDTRYTYVLARHRVMWLGVFVEDVLRAVAYIARLFMIA